MCLLLFPWLFPGEVYVVEHWLTQPHVVFTFNGIWEMVFEKCVALEEVAVDGNISLYNFLNYISFKHPCHFVRQIIIHFCQCSIFREVIASHFHNNN